MSCYDDFTVIHLYWKDRWSGFADKCSGRFEMPIRFRGQSLSSALLQWLETHERRRQELAFAEHDRTVLERPYTQLQRQTSQDWLRCGAAAGAVRLTTANQYTPRTMLITRLRPCLQSAWTQPLCGKQGWQTTLRFSIPHRIGVGRPGELQCE